MNNPNPFVPQGSVLERNKRHSTMKLAVGCLLAVGVCSLTAMLIQGCKREQEAPPQPMVDTNTTPMLDTNLVPISPTNMVVPPISNPPTMTPVTPVAPEATGSQYTVVKGDSLAKIAKANHVSLKALEDANPGVQPTKLKVGQKLTIPAGGSAAPSPTGAAATPDMTGAGGGEMYVVKSGDTLTKIAKAHGTTVKAIENENNLSTTKIKVGQKLKLPGAAAAPAPAPAPVMPAPAMTPAPGGAPAGQ